MRRELRSARTIGIVRVAALQFDVRTAEVAANLQAVERGLERAAREGIELVANQNVFGHMARWLEHTRYRHLAEAPDGWKTKWDTPMPPGVLAPTEESLAFVQSLLRELLPHFRSRQVNVNCDETFELGKGRSQADVAARGRGRVYVDFLKRILAGLHADGHDVLFWGDIVREHPELVPELPRERTFFAR